MTEIYEEHPMVTDAGALADRIERAMIDSAWNGEGHIFDLSPEEQPITIAALRLYALTTAKATDGKP